MQCVCHSTPSEPRLLRSAHLQQGALACVSPALRTSSSKSRVDQPDIMSLACARTMYLPHQGEHTRAYVISKSAVLHSANRCLCCLPESARCQQTRRICLVGVSVEVSLLKMRATHLPALLYCTVAAPCTVPPTAWNSDTTSPQLLCLQLLGKQSAADAGQQGTQKVISTVEHRCYCCTHHRHGSCCCWHNLWHTWHGLDLALHWVCTKEGEA